MKKSQLLKRTLCHRKSKYSLSLFPRYRQMPPKDSIEQNKSSSLEIKCRSARVEVDYSSWNLVYWQVVTKSNLPLLWNFDFSSRYFCQFSWYFFASISFGDGCFQFQDNKVSLKQAPGKTRYFSQNSSVSPPLTATSDFKCCPYRCSVLLVCVSHSWQMPLILSGSWSARHTGHQCWEHFGWCPVRDHCPPG